MKKLFLVLSIVSSLFLATSTTSFTQAIINKEQVSSLLSALKKYAPRVLIMSALGNATQRLAINLITNAMAIESISDIAITEKKRAVLAGCSASLLVMLISLLGHKITNNIMSRFSEDGDKNQSSIINDDYLVDISAYLSGLFYIKRDIWTHQII